MKTSKIIKWMAKQKRLGLSLKQIVKKFNKLIK